MKKKTLNLVDKGTFTGEIDIEFKYELYEELFEAD